MTERNLDELKEPVLVILEDILLYISFNYKKYHFVFTLYSVLKFLFRKRENFKTTREIKITFLLLKLNKKRKHKSGNQTCANS